jgi:hypothetical protein
MGSKKWERTGQYAGAGLATGAAVGSLAGPVGTVVGGAVGAVGGAIGGFIGGFIEDNNNDDALEDAMSEQEKEKSRAKKDAYNQYILGEAQRNGADPSLLAYQGYKSGLKDIDHRAEQNRSQVQSQFDDATAYDPNSLMPLLQAGGSFANTVYKQNLAPAQNPVAPLTADQFQATNNPVITHPTEMGVEGAGDWDEENLKPLRRGTRMGFGGSTY